MVEQKLNLSFIKERRLNLNLTLQEMADLMGMKSKENYFRYENGDFAFKANDVPKLELSLNTSKESLFTPKVTKLET